jgi:beta-galactosidase
MKKAICFTSLLLITLFAIGIYGCNKMKMMENTRTTSFDQGWRFIKENPSSAENPAFDDSKWRIVDLPHDWSIEDLPGQSEGSVIGPFSKTTIGYIC